MMRRKPSARKFEREFDARQRGQERRRQQFARERDERRQAKTDDGRTAGETQCPTTLTSTDTVTRQASMRSSRRSTGARQPPVVMAHLSIETAQHRREMPKLRKNWVMQTICEALVIHPMHPTIGCAVAKQLIMAVEQSASLQDFSRCETQEDIGRQLLRQVGVLDAGMTDTMVAAASDANIDFVATLERIAAGN
jgi:hypothetical protein